MSRFLTLRGWTPKHLLAAWSAYWAGLVFVTLGPPVLALLRVTSSPGSHASASAKYYSDGVVRVIVNAGSSTAWSGSAQPVSIALWLAGPPLLLWLAWMVARPSRTVGGLLEASSPRMVHGKSVPLGERVRAAGEKVDRD